MPFTVRSVGIREMKGEVESAVGNLAVDGVLAFRRFVITLALFRADRRSPESDLVGFQSLGAFHKRKCSRGFDDENAIGRGKRKCLTLRAAGEEDDPEKATEESLGRHGEKCSQRRRE